MIILGIHYLNEEVKDISFFLKHNIFIYISFNSLSFCKEDFLPLDGDIEIK
jgi:hypothetical protein